MVSVLVFGILEGILIGVLLSFIDLVERIYNPKIVVLGRINGTNKFADLERHPENEQVPGVLIVRVDGYQIFVSAENIRDSILELIHGSDEPIKLLILDFKSSPIIDIT